MVADLNLLGSVGDLYCFSNTLSMLVIIVSFTNQESFSCSQWFLYSSVYKFVMEDTDENGENWYMTNNKQFTVCSMLL